MLTSDKPSTRAAHLAGPAAAALCALLVALPAMALGQASAIHKTTLQDLPFPTPKFHSVTIRTVVDPKGGVPRHIHPGVEMGYVLSGTAELSVAGQAPRALSAGDSFAIPANTIHSARNTGAGPLTMLSTYVVDKNRPILIPAP
jgi:quercetin dioxygenase-like cupin family protein